MKIALLSPMIQPVGEPFVGGIESFLYRFAIGLRRAGIEVVCYACEGSFIPGVEIRTCGVPGRDLAYPQPPDEMSGEEILKIRSREDAVFYRVMENIAEDTSIDIIHNNSASGIPFYLARFIPMPIVHTIHFPPVDAPAMSEALHFCLLANREAQVVCVSYAQTQLWNPYYPIRHVIYNGLDIQEVPTVHTRDGTLIFVGRMSPTKGVVDAIEVATRLGKSLNIYGAPQQSTVSYFENHVQPLIRFHKNVTYHGSVDQQTLQQGLRKAQALVFPIKWDEPFGNVIAEAMSVGTPVVMYDRGPAQELISEGVNGYVVPPDDLAQMEAAIQKTETLNSYACASYAYQLFSLATCVEQYLDLFKQQMKGK